jgi:hypothetical protein
MLPFTKRPGRGDESGENDVVTKDDLATAETINPKAKGASGATPLPSVRAKFASLSDDEMTNIMPSKSIGDALDNARAASPRPAAGMPPPAASSARTGQRTVPPSRPSATSANRSGKFVAQDDEEEDGRTVVRGAPKIVKRTTNAPNAKMGQPTMPTTISPAAVIKATLESARAAQNKKNGDHLMAPPPKDLLEDLSDLRHPADGPGSEHTKILQTTGSGSVAPPAMQSTLPLQAQAMGHGSIPPGSARPMSAPPPGMVGQTTGASGGYPAQQSGGYPSQQSGGYPAQYNGPVPSGSVSAPGVSMPASMPAHFMVPQAPYSDGRMDPPGTAVTARTRVAGRPAMSWAMALMAFGLFVGVGAFAVMRGNADGFMETSASFVDPARAGAGAPKAVAAAAAAPAAPTPVPVAAEQPAVVGVPGVAVPAAAPVVTTAAAVVAAPAAPAPPPPVAVVAPAVPVPAPAIVAAAPAPRPTHRPRAAPQPAAAEEPVAVATPAPKPTGRVKPPPPEKKPAGDPSVDEEQKKALKQLQESQLESTF